MLESSFHQRLLLSVLLFLIVISSVEQGSARITSSFVRNEWPAVDMPLDHEAFAIPEGYNAPQQVRNISFV